MVKKQKRFEELDALRGVAVLLVFMFYYVMITEEFYDWFVFGTTGVDLFFMISGFVITMSISHVASGKEFVVNRFARLYPTYWMSVTFTFVLICTTNFFKDLPFPWVELNFGFSLVLSFLLCVLIATFITYLIEIPINKRLRIYLNRKNYKN